ncbi:MAG: flagellar basal body rod protein FlgB [Clostridia bacterium]|nr:flagellar basal body rod protein FlgB [Clostridia bacterium]
MMVNAVGYLKKALDASWMRNNVITNNIANVDTQNFQASEVEFESFLKDAMDKNSVSMRTTNSKHISSPGDRLEPVVTQENSSLRMDGNNVDIEKEQTNLAQNALYYNTLIQKLGEEYSRIRFAISEGK